MTEDQQRDPNEVGGPQVADDFLTFMPVDWRRKPVAKPTPPPLAAPHPTPDERIWIIEKSLSCLAYGAWSLVPVIGLPLSVMGVMRFYEVRRATRRCWNPARAPLLMGALFSVLGLWPSLWLLALLHRFLGAVAFDLIPVVVFTGSFFLWCFGSLGGGLMNDSFRNRTCEMFIWFALAAGFAVRGMLAMVNESKVVVALSLLIPLALFMRLVGAVFSAKVRASVLASVGLHVTWAVLSVPFLGATAFELGLWHKVSVGGVSLFDFWRSLW
ncbi:MAG: hypothetical protein HY300_04725 [Verrucomicrobia bacterium]|nr:hypothetical protein [Verrucomicrobiota bacterium]